MCVCVCVPYKGSRGANNTCKEVFPLKVNNLNQFETNLKEKEAKKQISLHSLVSIKDLKWYLVTLYRIYIAGLIIYITVACCIQVLAIHLRTQ